MSGSLGRRTPTDFTHVEKYPFRAVMAEPPVKVERVLRLPWWHWTHNQGKEGSCVGHAVAMERAIANTLQNMVIGSKPFTRRYDPIDIWNSAKSIDEWPDTNPGDSEGTSVRAGYDVMRDRGPRRVRTMRLEGEVPKPVGLQAPQVSAGADVNRWATTVDEMRRAIYDGTAVTIGVNWYASADRPVPKGNEMWICLHVENLGALRGGHAVCVYGASDRRQAFRVKNSWGKGYPLVWMPYATMGRLLAESGEAAIVTDR